MAEVINPVKMTDEVVKKLEEVFAKVNILIL
jgi:hypothetical protein